MAGRAGLGRKIALAAGALALTLIVCELIGTLYATFFYPRLTVTDPVLGWKYEPTPAAVERRDAAGDVNRLFINSDGFRDDEFSAADDLVRILVLGDSMTFGLEADQHEVYPSRLERALRERFGTTAIDVMNLGITGYGTVQELLALESYAPRYPPDVVLLMFFELNDFDDNVTVFNNRFVPHFVPAGDTLRRVDRPAAVQRLKNSLRDHSTLFFLLAHRFAPTRRLMRESLPLDREAAVDLTVDVLGRVHDYTRRRDVPFLLFYVRDARAPADGVEALSAFARSRNIPFRLLPLVDSQRVGGRGHWNAEGHAAAARLVEEALFGQPDVLERIHAAAVGPATIRAPSDTP